MEIILMRHGKPTYIGNPKVNCDEMADWVAQYNLSDTGSDMPPESRKSMASKASLIISSPLPRALSSLSALGCEPDIIDDVFREADLPLIRIHGVKLPPTYWAVFFRVMWLCGMSNRAESLGMAKKRAFKAAELLVNHAKKSNRPVLLMGHGVMNRLIARELISLSCIENCRLGREHWNVGVYKLPQVKP
ncbi:histidine phosphatase family protein [Pectobacterium parmentieri]|uniref:histidine phosphatase family protein n=1 Tax=Pectobacterium parmentieri TaxID=1905730 RepID=UPI000675FAB5|nr:histidine phosphatase family protein [Pectobacterium parmentieri]PWD61864.1 histidine phosphatase family protein [Pectobacterium parmentieri]